MTGTIERAQPNTFNAEQIDLIKNTVAVGTSDLELALFMEVCKSTGLNPFQRQIYAVVRKSKSKQGNQWVETSKMVIQTGIDGYRLIAARSGLHIGTTDPEFGPMKDGYPEWARVIVRKLVHGHVAEFPATARWAEYVQQKAEYSNGSPTGRQIVSDMWVKMPHTMLGKCAESLALRKAFPAELSGVYTDSEMAQAEVAEPTQVQQESKTAAPSDSERLDKAVRAIGARVDECRAAGRLSEAQAFLHDLDYRVNLSDAEKAFKGLRQFTVPAPVEVLEAPVEAEIVSEIETITDKQRKALMAQMKRLALPNTNEARSAFYAWMVGTADGIRTNDLDTETAQGLIDTLSAMDSTEVEATAAQFNREVKL